MLREVRNEYIDKLEQQGLSKKDIVTKNNKEF
jgi:uncharacterized protein YggE